MCILCLYFKILNINYAPHKINAFDVRTAREGRNPFLRKAPSRFLEETNRRDTFIFPPGRRFLIQSHDPEDNGWGWVTRKK